MHFDNLFEGIPWLVANCSILQVHWNKTLLSSWGLHSGQLVAFRWCNLQPSQPVMLHSSEMQVTCKYAAAATPWLHFHIRTADLKVTFRTGIQCKLCRICIMGSWHWVPNNKQATAFCTDCSRFVYVSAVLVSNVQILEPVTSKYPLSVVTIGLHATDTASRNTICRHPLTCESMDSWLSIITPRSVALELNLVTVAGQWAWRAAVEWQARSAGSCQHLISVCLWSSGCNNTLAS